MKKHHGLTVALASLSAATASIVTGAFVSQSATASTDTPTEATVTVVSATTGEQPVMCTFDDVALPSPDAVLEATASVVSVGGASVGGEAAVAGGGGVTGVRGVGALEELSLDVASGAVRVFSTDEARVGTSEECATLRAELAAPATSPMVPASPGRPATSPGK